MPHVDGTLGYPDIWADISVGAMAVARMVTAVCHGVTSLRSASPHASTL
jgi:hypothetical protein